MSRSQFVEILDRYAREGRVALLWLRDDDAIEPTEPLARLLDLSSRWDAPMTIASIPARATRELSRKLSGMAKIAVAVHGWDHVNHASASEKKQELGLHRQEALVLSQIEEGLSRIGELFGDNAVPLLVPPWNRIAPSLIGHLPALGYSALSVFGPEPSETPLALVNTHVDIIDWKAGRRGRDLEHLYADAASHLSARTARQPSLGILTHHLVHDEAAWRFLDDLFELTSIHPGCRWVGVQDLMRSA